MKLSVMFLLAWAFAVTLPQAAGQGPTVTIIATDADAAETLPGETPNPGEFLVSRTGDASSALRVVVRLRGDAIQGIDYRFASPVTTTFTISAGSGSLAIPVYPIDDALTEPDERVEIEILENNAYIVGADDRARLEIHDNEDPNLPPRAVVSVVAIDADAMETSTGAVNTATFRITRAGNTNAALEVTYRLGGTATLDVDYTAPLSVIIPAGALSADVVISPIEDTVIEGTESITLDLQDPICVAVFPPPPECYVVGLVRSATLWVFDNDFPPPPSVTLNAAQNMNVVGLPCAVSGAFSATDPDGYISAFSIYLDGNFVTGGSTGYSEPPLSGTPFETTFEITNVSPSIHQVRVSVTDNTGTTASAFTTVWLVILPPPTVPLPVLEVFADDAEAGETSDQAEPNPGRFVITRSGPTNSAVLFFYKMSGNARIGADYNLSLPYVGYSFLAAGQTRAEIDVRVIDDLFVEGPETATLSLYFPFVFNEGPPVGPRDFGFEIGSNNTATVTILDNDTEPPPVPIITIAATDPVAAEVPPALGTNDHAVFTVTRDGPTNADVTVHYAIIASPRVQNGVDFQQLPGTVTIPAGAIAAEIVVVPIFDVLLEGDETVQLTVLPSPLPLPHPASYLIDTGTVASIVIHDYAPNEIPVVTIRANDPQAIEDPVIRRNGSFIVQRSGNVSNSITVAYDIGGSASNGVDYQTLPGFVAIPADSRGAYIAIIPIADSISEGIEAVGLALRAPPVDVYPPSYLVGDPRSAGVSIQDHLRRARAALLPGGFFVVPVPASTPCCVIEASTNLVDWQQIGVSDASQAAGEIDQFIDVDAASQQMRFYRAIPCPVP